MAYKLFVNTNVYLDFLMQRGNDTASIKAIFDLAEAGAITVYTSASSLLNIMYVMGAYKLQRKEIVNAANAILSYTTLVNPDNITFEIALASKFTDMEDAVQYYTALEINEASFFITSNLKDYKHVLPHLPVITPGAFMSMYTGA